MYNWFIRFHWIDNNRKGGGRFIWWWWFPNVIYHFFVNDTIFISSYVIQICFWKQYRCDACLWWESVVDYSICCVCHVIDNNICRNKCFGRCRSYWNFLSYLLLFWCFVYNLWYYGCNNWEWIKWWNCFHCCRTAAILTMSVNYSAKCK